MRAPITEVEEAALPVADSGAGNMATAGRYDDDAKRKGLSKGTKIAIVVGIGIALIAAILGYKAAHPLSGINLGKL